MIVTNALEAAQALTLALFGDRGHGEATVQLVAGEVRILKKLQTLKPDALAEIPVPDPPPQA